MRNEIFLTPTSELLHTQKLIKTIRMSIRKAREETKTIKIQLLINKSIKKTLNEEYTTLIKKKRELLKKIIE